MPSPEWLDQVSLVLTLLFFFVTETLLFLFLREELVCVVAFALGGRGAASEFSCWFLDCLVREEGLVVGSSGGKRPTFGLRCGSSCYLPLRTRQNSNC